MSAAILARAFVVTAAKGARCVERQSMTSQEIARLPHGFFFHGAWAGAWVRRLGGGYVFFAAVREVA